MKNQDEMLKEIVDRIKKENLTLKEVYSLLNMSKEITVQCLYQKLRYYCIKNNLPTPFGKIGKKK
jgi:hypothetical protein